jgi:hypothetical protein
VTFRMPLLAPVSLFPYVTNHLLAYGWTVRVPTLPPGAMIAGLSIDAGIWFRRTLASGKEATALISPQASDGYGSSWLLTATAPPNGPMASGC